MVIKQRSGQGGSLLRVARKVGRSREADRSVVGEVRTVMGRPAGEGKEGGDGWDSLKGKGRP